MNAIHNNFYQELGALSTGQVVARLVTGSALILFSLFYQGVFANIAILPLLAIYPVFTGLIGVDPFYLLWQKYVGVRSEFNIVSRSLLVVTAAVLIGSVMASHGELGWRGVLALVAVYPALAAIIGRDPFNAFVDYKSGDLVTLKSKEKTKIKEKKVKKAA